MKFKKYGIQILLLSMLTIFALPLDGILGSGSRIFISDIVISIVSVVYLGMCLLKKTKINKKQDIFLKYILVFASYLFITASIHTFQFGFSKDYIMIIRNFYAIAFILLFASGDGVSRKVIENTLLIFITISNIYQLIYFAMKFEIRSSQLFYNVVIYAIAMQVALAFLFKVSATKSKQRFKTKKLIADFNIISIICLIPMSGLRFGTLVMFVLLLFYMLYFSFWYGKKMFIKCVIGMGAVVLLSGGVITSAYLTNNERLIAVITRTFNIDLNKQTSINTSTTGSSTSTKKIDTRSQSDQFREAINDKAIDIIQDNALIGKGELQVGVFDRSTGKTLERLPHNIILEMLIAYGIIGTTIFMSFLLLPYYNKNVRFRKKRYYILSFSILVGFFVFSMVQPTINRILPLQIFFLVQVYFMKCDDLPLKKSKRRLDKYAD